MHESEKTRERLFDLLSFLYNPRSIQSARDTLRLASPEKQAYALEGIDVTVAQELKPLILPVFEELALEGRFDRLDSLFPQPRLGREGRLKELFGAGGETLNPWIVACAIYAASLLHGLRLPERLNPALETRPGLTGETMAWISRRKNGGQDGATQGDPLGMNQHEGLTANHLEIFTERDDKMLTTIEKVLILKTVSIFSETPDEILAEVAQVLKEVEAEAGQTILEKGAMVDDLFIVVEGKVRVHDGDTTLNFLGERDVFGEMAVLDPEPRSASVTALEECLLLSLDRETLRELMEDSADVAVGIFRVLSQRLRARMQDLIATTAQQAGPPGMVEP